MNTINGNVNAGRDVNVANRDIHIYEHNETHKSYDQMLPEELRAEDPLRRKKLRARGASRRAKAPKWLILPAVGAALGIYFASYVLALLQNHVTIKGLFNLFVYFINQYPPYVVMVIVLAYVIVLWLLPIQRIFNLLLKDDDVMREHRAALRYIAHRLEVLS